MSPAAQIPLFEPTGAEVPALALAMARRADAARRQASIAASRGWPAIERGYVEQARAAEIEAECLAMLAEFERLAGVS